MSHLFDLSHIAICANTKSFYENILAEVEVSPMRVAESPIGKWIDGGNRKRLGHIVGVGEYFLSAAYLPQHVETFPGLSPSAIETSDGL